MAIEVQLISAEWCKRCKDIKPIVIETCKMNGATYEEVDYETMEEADKEAIKSLPTIRMRLGTAWTIYVANTLDVWKQTIASLSISQATAYDDF